MTQHISSWIRELHINSVNQIGSLSGNSICFIGFCKDKVPKKTNAKLKVWVRIKCVA